MRASLSFLVGALSSVLLASSCGDDDALPPAPEQPAGFADALAMSTLEDLDPDPAVLEVNLEAKITGLELSPGTTTQAWTYAGSVPGPLLRLRVGDRLIVHFRNSLPEATSVHWHGVRVPNAMDGAPPHTQAPVPPGGTFDYDFVVPDAGLFWYHPHMSSAAQLGFGLYGALLVDPATPEPPGLGDEVVLVLSDASIDPATGAFYAPDQGGDIATLFGREGAALLVNGRVRPTLKARSGLRQRWRIVNTAKSRYYELTLPGHSFERIGGETGLLASPEERASIVLAPGQRADVSVRLAGAPGEVVSLIWNPFDRGYGSVEYRPPEPLLDVALEGETVPAEDLPALGGGAEPLDLTGAVPVLARLTQGLDAEGGLVLGINDVPFAEAGPFFATVGETQVWTVTNEMEWAHPFHLHGFFFQELDESGAVVQPAEWRDTVHVPKQDSVRFAVRYDARPGMWMFHCHILDHADAGMMGMIDLRQ